MTSNTARLHPSESWGTIDGKRSKAMADQLATVSKQRLLACIGVLAVFELRGLEQAIRVQLGLF